MIWLNNDNKDNNHFNIYNAFIFTNPKGQKCYNHPFSQLDGMYNFFFLVKQEPKPHLPKRMTAWNPRDPRCTKRGREESENVPSESGGGHNINGPGSLNPVWHRSWGRGLGPELRLQLVLDFGDPLHSVLVIEAMTIYQKLYTLNTVFITRLKKLATLALQGGEAANA